MGIQTTFQRYEMKYLMTREQKYKVLRAMAPYMKLDDYGHTTIRNIYFDTEDYRLIRHSIEKPDYKEKLRIRSYKAVSQGDPVFVELKKKFNSVVYKRRLTLPEGQVRRCFESNLPLPAHSQIAREIAYFREYYQNLRPAVFLSYEREAYYERSGGDFRVTFDENILYRTRNFSLGSDIYGASLLKGSMCLMELKTSGGLPIWMCQILTRENLHKTSFSKYGAAYEQIRKGDLKFENCRIERNMHYA